MDDNAEIIRVAEPGDAEAIIDILRSSYDPAILPYTIYASERATAYVRDVISMQRIACGTVYTICVRENRTIGFTEFRRDFDQLFLNNIDIKAGERGRGIGSRLLSQSISLVRNANQQRIGLDVFRTNHAAYEWYQRLGFELRNESVWSLHTTGPAPQDDAQLSFLHGLHLAKLAHEEYGFSQFTLTTRLRSYEVGKMGRHLFRIGTHEILADRAALAALNALDSGRALLCIGPLPKPMRSAQNGARAIATGCRLWSEVDPVCSRLAPSISRGKQ